jgi:hypothetical protein
MRHYIFLENWVTVFLFKINYYLLVASCMSSPLHFEQNR